MQRPIALAALVALVALGAARARAEDLAITFDDLPLNGPLPPATTRARIVRDALAILHAHRAPPVYGFVNGAKLEDNADGAQALRLWAAGGERLGNHSYAHTDLNAATAAAFLDDVWRNEPVLERLDPAGRWHWLRYPYLREGDTLEKRRAVRTALAARGYRIAQVTLDWEDYLWNGAYARCVERGDQGAMARLETGYLAIAAAYIDGGRKLALALYGRPISHVLLLHLGAFTSRILPPLLGLLERKGFRLVTLEAAERDAALAVDPDAASRYGGTLLEQLAEARALAYPPLPPKPYRELEALCR
ncbi:MAG TPA: polysaccharide deacetylase family protein [Steroidobacteraceae bacterium]|nr:polysaccharide deacetylase family protein [Steroidobacteraceae bacterium]